MAPTPTDPRTEGNNDKLWDQVTEDENLQAILYAFFMAQGMSDRGDEIRALEGWLENNIAGCSAELYAATRIDQASYCDEVVAPGRGEFCHNHQEEPPDDDDYHDYREDQDR